MSEDTRRFLGVLGFLTAALAVMLALWRGHEYRRPQLVGVTVVYLVEGDELAREDPQPVTEGTKVWAAALLQMRQGNGPVRFLCPCSRVLWQGKEIRPEPVSAWPDSYGVLKAHWYTVEPAFFGAEGVTPTTAEKLSFKDFVAPELGNELKTLLSPEAHNDDFLSEPVAGNTLGGGIWRLKVKVSAYRSSQDLLPWASVSSPGATDLPVVASLGRLALVPAGINPRVSLAFRAGVFTFADGVWPSGGAGWPGPVTPQELVRGLFIMTPRAAAALAATGDPLAEPWSQPQELVLRQGRWWRRRGMEVRWGQDLRPGDALYWDERWMVAWADDGNGFLDGKDTALLAWLQPLRLIPLERVERVTSALFLRRAKGAER